MASSRIFVRGLPPSIKENELRKHFDSFDSKDQASTALTDAHFIPHRRIGYVGYKTPEAAAKAVKFFNKSFIRMSKIVAELARPVEEGSTQKRKRSSLSPLPDQSAKKTSNHGEKQPQQEKLASLVESMQKASKGRLWSNEDTIPAESVVVEEAQKRDPESEDEEYQQITKSQINSEKSTDYAGPSNQAVAEVRSKSSAKVSLSLDDPSTKDASEQDNEVTVPPASDTDWLRSRTNRVLDLLDDDDIDAQVSTDTRQPTTDPNANDESEINIINQPKSDSTRQAQGEEDAQSPVSSERLLVRNIVYSTTDDELLKHFEPYGTVEEIHICHDAKTGRSKGFAFVQLSTSEEAAAARTALSGKPFQGRNIQIEIAVPKREHGIDESALAKLPLKIQKQIRDKSGAHSENFRWNSLYMSTDAIMSSVAARLGVSKTEILDPTSSDAAVKQAHAESQTIQDTQSFLRKHGVDIEAFKQARRGGSSDTVILVKNFPFGTTAAEIREVFEKHGTVQRLLVPPSATIAILEMGQPVHAKRAFSALAYSKFKDSMLLLEKAPKNIFSANRSSDEASLTDTDANLPQASADDIEDQFEQQAPSATSSIFADRLPWGVSTADLHKLFCHLDGYLSARVMTRTDPKKPGQILSRGFGFIEFREKSQAKEALLQMNGQLVDGKQPLVLRASHRSSDRAEEQRQEDKDRKLANQQTRIIIKNLPFEATKKDVRALFTPYGQLRSIRVPKKFDSSSRGFAFADFVSAKEAKSAMEALRNTHLLGRRLALGFATADTVDPEQEIARMQKKVEQQADKVSRQTVAAGGRKKFRAYEQSVEDQ